MARPELEFFILSIVVDHYEGLKIFEAPELGIVVNRKVPEFTHRELMETLSNLFRCGDVNAFLHADEDKSSPFIPTIEEIDAALFDALEIDYGLTAQGGARWEAMSQFDWNFHLGDWREEGIGGPSREMVETYLAYDRCALRGSERWMDVRPWHATYWKTLPNGVRVHYKEAEPSSEYEPPELKGLWIDEWNEGRKDDLRVFVPMEPGRSDPVVAEPWRVRFKSAPQRSSEHLLTLLHEGETAIQYAAAMTLAGSGDSSFVPALLGWVVERQSCYSLRAISQVRDPRVLNTLLQFLPGLKDSPNLSRRGFERDLCLAIAQFGNGAIEKLAELLRLGSLPVQVRVLDILANIQTQEARTLILDWLNAFPIDQSNEHCQSVRKALDALARFKDPRVLDILERLLEWKPDWVIEPLILLDHPAAWKMLEAFVRSGTNLHTRRHTLRQMAIADPRYKEESERLAREAVAEGLRRAAALLLGVDWRQPLSDPLNRICEVLSDPNPKRRFQAISLICRHEAAAFPLDRVAALLDDTDAEVRANAVDALGLRGTERQIPAMQKLTHDPSGLVRYCAREALGKARQRKPS